MQSSQAASPYLTFEEYRFYDDGTENRYELVDGVLQLSPQASKRHIDLNDRLFELLLPCKQKGYELHREAGVRTGIRRSRTPDLLICTPEQWATMPDTGAGVLEVPPRLVVEIVSDSSSTTDYRAKRVEYAAMGVPEYWIIDPLERRVMILEWREGAYDEVNSSSFGQEVELAFDPVRLF